METFTKIKHKCLACGSELSEPLFEISNMPFGAQAMPSKDELKEDAGIDLGLCSCPHCGLVQFDCEPVPYYKDAIRVVGLSETMKELRRADYRLLIDKYHMGGKKWLECGCSNGDFLKVLTEFDVDIYGTEHGEDGLADSRRKLCEEAGVPREHIMRFFPDRADMEIPGAPFDVFLSFNFLEHMPDPVTMLKCLHKNLKDDGVGLISVPSFEYIIGEGRYYELVRDHIANYDMDSFTNLCLLSGFEVLEKGFIGIGDTLRIVVKKAAGNEGEETALYLHSDAENADITVLKDDYVKMRKEVADYMQKLQLSGRRAALWGAGHQGFTIAATTAMTEHICYIIDSSDKKQGKFAPASHIPIVSPDHYPEDPVDVIIISAPGYVKEIDKAIRERYKDTEAGIPAICSILDFTER